MRKSKTNQSSIVVLVVFQTKQGLIRLKGRRILFNLAQMSLLLKIQNIEEIIKA